jgi:predicted metal-dependent hydrolase
MKISLQPNPENRVGDWMLFMHSTVIWVYGYQEGPYLLPVFLTPRVFSLEFIRQRIISETKHFLKMHKASNLKFPFIIGPFVVKTRSCLPQIQAKLSEFGFTQLQGRKYDPHQVISKRRLMSRQGPYEHEHVEGFDKLENLETCADMEVILQPDQTQQVESAPQQIQTQKTSPRLTIKAPKMSVYNKRSSSEALGTSSQQNVLKKMKITPSSQIVDLEEEEPKEKMSMEMVERRTKNEEANTESMPQGESSSRVFSSKKHVFSKTPGAVYQSKEDLANQYIVKGNMAMSEIRDLLPEVERISQHKSSLFSVRDVERKTFNIAVADEDKVSEIKLHYENIGAPDKVKFHRNASDMLYSDYLSLSLRVSRLTTHALKLDGQLKQEKASSRAWQTQVKRLESEGPQGVKSSLDEKEKMIQSLKKKLKMSATEHPQTTELAALEKEKETFRQEALNYKAKVLQLEKEKESWSQGQAVTSDVVVVVPSTVEIGPNALMDLVQAMSQVSLKEGEIKNLRGDIERLQQEMKIKNEKMAQFQRENQELQERVSKIENEVER